MPINKIPDKKRDGLQAYRVRVSYTDSNGKYCQVERTAYGKEAAQTLEQQLLTEYKDKKQTKTARMTVNDLITEYGKYHAMETKRSSHETAMKTLRLRVSPYVGDCRLDKLTQPKLAEWKISLAGTDLSDTTKKNAYSAFSALLYYAIKMGYIDKNPLTVLGNFKESADIEKQPEKIRYYTSEQFVKYISVAEKHCITLTDWDYYVFFCIAFFTGCRKGEIHALKWSDIDGDILHIRRSITQKLQGGDLETTPKTKSSIRDLKIPEPLMGVLTAHKERQRQAAPQQFSNDFRICGGTQPLRDTSIDKHNRLYAQEAELPHITIHEFRHSHASYLVNNNIQIQEVSRRLGHSNVQMTWQVYSHLYPVQEQKAIEALNKISLENPKSE